MNNIKQDNPVEIEVKGLYKIFGDKSQDMMEHVKNGIGKDELLNQYGHVLGLNDINFSIKKGEIYVFMGLSGSGKSTLIRHLNRLIDPTAGEVLIEGENILNANTQKIQKLRQTKISMVFQKFGLMPHMSILENVSYGLLVQKKDKDFIEEKARYWIEKVGLSGFENYAPSNLSGGMQQRVGLARALATDSEIILMDEAFSALDPLIRTEMQDLLLQLQKELKKTIVFITHDLEEAIKLGDKIAILKDGYMVQQGTSQDIILNPADDYIKNFTENINLIQSLFVDGIMKKLSKTVAVANQKKYDILVDYKTKVKEVLAQLEGKPTAKVGVTQKDIIVGEININDIIKVI